jgi:hypothetical protein
VGFEDLPPVVMKISVFWDIKLFIPWKGSLSTDCTAVYPRRYKSLVIQNETVLEYFKSHPETFPKHLHISPTSLATVRIGRST